MKMPNEEVIDILGVKVNATNLGLACQKIASWIERKEKNYVCVAPVSTIVDCQRDPVYRDIVNGSGMTTPDGMPLVWLGRLYGHAGMGRTYGPDLMKAFCDYSRQKGYRHFFYGGTEGTNQGLTARLKEEFPHLQIAGSYAPAMLEVNQEEQADVLERINAARPDVLWVGLGSPKQDYWMVRYRDQLAVPVMIGVGAAFDFLAGAKKQAPRWMQRSGLEWFYRLCCEPQRLWKRYLIGNSLFVFWLAKDFLMGKLKKHGA